MITGAHSIVLSGDATATRAFCRDILELTSIDAGGGWLIFALPPAELAAHPTDERPHHELYLMCDDLYVTVEELQRKGVDSPGHRRGAVGAGDGIQAAGRWRDGALRAAPSAPATRCQQRRWP